MRSATLQMTTEPDRFKHFMLVRTAGGQPVYLSRSPDETVLPAFDHRAGQLVELHVLPESASLDAAGRRSVIERATLAAELQSYTFMQILETGEDDGLIYYSSILSDAEPVTDYIARRGALPPATAFCLILQLLDDLVSAQSYHRLTSQMTLGSLQVTVRDGSFLHLRIVDFGLAKKERRSGGDLQRLSVEVCELIFLMLAGRPFRIEIAEQFPELACMACGLRSRLLNILTDNTQAPETPATLRDEISKALALLVDSVQADDTQEHLRMTADNPPPVSQIQGLAFARAKAPAPVSAMADPAPARRKIHGALIWSAVTFSVVCLLVWFLARDSQTPSPSKHEASIIPAPDIVRRAIIPSTDEIADYHRQKAVGAKVEPPPLIIKRAELGSPTVSR